MVQLRTITVKGALFLSFIVSDDQCWEEEGLPVSAAAIQVLLWSMSGGLVGRLFLGLRRGPCWSGILPVCQPVADLLSLLSLVPRQPAFPGSLLNNPLLTPSSAQCTLESVSESQFLYYMLIISDYNPRDSKCPVLKFMGLLGFSSPPASQRKMAQHNISISVDNESKMIVKREMSLSSWF